METRQYVSVHLGDGDGLKPRSNAAGNTASAHFELENGQTIVTFYGTPDQLHDLFTAAALEVARAVADGQVTVSPADGVYGPVVSYPGWVREGVIAESPTPETGAGR